MENGKPAENLPSSSPLESKEGEAIDDSYPSYFQCCVCLDLLYKPIILACGHMSCFWCVHKAMHGLRASHCPLCRQPYIHFPSICQLLHHLLLTLEPAGYKRRETEVLEEEKHRDVFSPQFGDSVIPGGTQEVIKGSADLKANKILGPEDRRLSSQKQVSINGVSCELCTDLLFQPASLNCGHVFCRSCLIEIEQENEHLKCPICGSLHPGGFPKVCLDLDHFLVEKFPKEYKMRKEKVQPNRVECQLGESSLSSTENQKEKIKLRYAEYNDFFTDEDLHNVHVGVGCDSCGMYPITGKRYKCIDCKEVIGFDQCEACYNSNSKVPGRFNQQHTPEHKFRLDESQMLAKILLRSLRPHIRQDSSTDLDMSQDLEELDVDDSPQGHDEDSLEEDSQGDGGSRK